MSVETIDSVIHDPSCFEHADKLLIWPDRRVEIPCVKVNDPDELVEASKLATTLLRVCTDHGGVGLAANQIGARKRVFILMVTAKSPEAYINPEVVDECASHSEWPEGCLSVLGSRYTLHVSRPKWIKIKALDRHGAVVEKKLKKLEARAFLHELDHLEGKTILDTCVKRDKPLALSFRTMLRKQAERAENQKE